MKKINPNILSVALSVSMVVFPMATFAAPLLDSSSDANVSGSVSSDASNALDAGVNVDLNSSTDSNASSSNTGAGSSADASLNVGVTGDVNLDNGSGFNLDSDTSSAVNLGEGSSIHMDRDSLEANIESGATASSMTSDRVSTADDLKAFASSSLQNDENLEGMTFSDSSVDVAYKARGRFLAIIPVSLKAVAHVSANGDVSVRYPWYHFLVTGENDSKLKTAIEGQIQAMVNSDSNAGTRLTSRQAAAIAARVHSVLRNNYNNQISASGNATVDSQASGSAN